MMLKTLAIILLLACLYDTYQAIRKIGKGMKKYGIPWYTLIDYESCLGAAYFIFMNTLAAIFFGIYLAW
jgi:hypothetical protein